MNRIYAKNLSAPAMDRVIERPAVLPALGGILTVFGFFYGFMPVILAFDVLGLIILILKIKREAKIIIAFTLIFSLFLSLSMYINLKNNDVYSVPEYVTITSAGRRLDGTFKYYVRDDGGRRLLLSDFNEYVPVGSRIYGNFTFSKPQSSSNPGGFDYEDYLKRQGISYITGVSSYNIVLPGRFFLIVSEIENFFFNFRKILFDKFTITYDDDTKGIFAAVLLGDSSVLTGNISNIFSKASMSHLLVVSGSHFSAFLVFLPLFMERIHIPIKKQRVICSVFIVFIGCLMNWSPSVTRAAFMALAALIYRDKISAMSLAAVIMMITDPYVVLNSGFQMSFLTTLSMILFSGKIDDFLQEKGLNEKLSSLFACYISAKTGMLIFAGSTEYEIGLSSLILQFVCSFIVELMCVFYIPAIPCVFLNFDFCKDIISVLIKLLSVTVQLSAHLSYYSLSLRNIDTAFKLIIIIFIVSVIYRSYKFLRIIRIPITFLLISAFLLNVMDYFFEDRVKIVFADVGQGDSCLIMCGGKSLLIDGGLYEKGESVLVPLLDYYNIEKPDYVVMTHWDMDHGGGILYLLENNRCDSVYTSYTEENSNVDMMLQDYKDLSIENFKPFYIGDTISLSENCTFTCIWPVTLSDGGNSDSIVLLAEIYDTKILFTGDIGEEEEKQITEIYDLSNTDILKVAHHGSKYSSSEIFLSEVRPEYSVISVGKYNNYGHPAPETLERLNNAETEIMRTSECGAVIVEIGKHKYEIYGYNTS